MDEFMSNIWNSEEFQVATDGCWWALRWLLWWVLVEAEVAEMQVMCDSMGFVPNWYAGMAVVPLPPPSQGGVAIDQSCERSISRRHRRMIKNRESGARSRARKQKTIVLTEKQMLVEKMIEQSKENVNAKKCGALLRPCDNCIW
uniref:BZIP domain-containing protein n=1 Tax=Aegilops tauschii TaxID=37682 RepID=N1QUW0_AEGTA